MVTYNLSSTLDGLAFLDQSIGTEQHNTDLTGFQVHAHALDTRGKPAIPLASCGEGAAGAWRTRRAPRPGHCSCRGHGQYRHCHSSSAPCFLRCMRCAVAAYPTESTRPVSARLFSSCTPRILCSKMEETSVGEAFASAA